MNTSDFATLHSQLRDLWEAVSSGEKGADQRRVQALELAGALLKWENEQPGALPGLAENRRVSLWRNVAETAGKRLEAVRAEAGEKKKNLQESIAQWQRDIDVAATAGETLRAEIATLQQEIGERQAEAAALNTENLPLAEQKAALEAERRDVAQILELHARLQEECAALAREEENLREGGADNYLRCFNQAAESLRAIREKQEVWRRRNEAIAGAMATLPFPEALREASVALGQAANALRESDRHLGDVVQRQEKKDKISASYL
jgi:chromosome segregation ATPase